ncbi:MAG: hypothetical protein IMX00_09250 [Limnochordales bacterium]|nr:hypothetical protein [Limnochordales bacterium]
MPPWLRQVIAVLTDEQIVEPLLLIAAVLAGREYHKNRRLQVLSDITLDLVDFIEEHYKEWGIRGPEKMERFLKLFVSEFRKRMGRAPSAGEIETARLRAEAYVQRIRRDQMLAQSPERARGRPRVLPGLAASRTA